jgi:hypothetical protein
MRPLTRRERLLGGVAGAALVVTLVGSWLAMEQRGRYAETVEIELDRMRARVERDHLGVDGPDSGRSIHDVVREVTGAGARVAESRDRWGITWRGDGPETWTKLASLAQVHDAVLTALSIRNAGRTLDVELVMEAPHAR